MTFDLENIDPVGDANEGAWLHIHDTRYTPPKPIFADGDPEKPCRLKIAGAHSSIATQEADRQNKRREKREAERYKKFKAEGLGEEEARRKSRSTTKEVEQDNAEYYAKITLAWENISWKGQTDLTFEILTEMYLNRAFIGGQVFSFLGKTEAFIRTPLSSCDSTSGSKLTTTPVRKRKA